MSVINLQVPEVFRPLFQPCRHKIVYGGRGSAKSWSVAICLIVTAAARPLRVMCSREHWTTIKDSVYQVLKAAAALCGLESMFDFRADEIRGRNGSVFSFRGLKDMTVSGVKSAEGYDVLWIEEGQYLTELTIRTILPTIRKDGSEILITFNPCLETDPVWQEFVVNPRPSTLIINANWRDNPFFSQVMNDERLHDQKRLPQAEYENIWEGKVKEAADGAIYADELARARAEGRIGVEVPIDKMLAIHAVFDLGFSDCTSVVVVQLRAGQIRVVDFFEDRRKPLSHYADELKRREYKLAEVWLPHDGFASSLQTGLSHYDMLVGLGLPCRHGSSSNPSVPRLTIENGIVICRETFPRVVFSKRAEGLVEHLRRYRRDTSVRTGAERAPLHDDHSHAADAFRYMCVSSGLMAETAGDALDGRSGSAFRPLNNYAGPVMMPF